MNDHDLSDALNAIAEEARHGTAPLPVDRIVRRRRHRRAATRGALSGGALLVVGALTVAGTGWLGRPDRSAPAASATPTPSVVAPVAPAWPTCGEPLGDPDDTGVDVALTGPVAAVTGAGLTVSGTLSGSGSAALPVADDVPATLALLRDGAVVALVPAGDDATWTPEDGVVRLDLGGVPEPCADAGDVLPAGDYEAVLAVRTATGVARSAAVAATVTDPEPQSPPETTGTGTATGTGRPLVDPWIDRWELIADGTYVPDRATGSDTLADGDYAVIITAIDPGAMTATVDVLQILTDEEVIARMMELDPEITHEYAAERIVAGDHTVNTSTRLRTVPLSPDVVTVGSCGAPPWREAVTLQELSGPRTGTTCRDGLGTTEHAYASDITTAQNVFWLDIRGGVGVQVVGDFQS